MNHCSLYQAMDTSYILRRLQQSRITSIGCCVQERWCGIPLFPIINITRCIFAMFPIGSRQSSITFSRPIVISFHLSSYRLLIQSFLPFKYREKKYATTHFIRCICVKIDDNIQSLIYTKSNNKDSRKFFKRFGSFRVLFRDI